jgi:DNA-binding NtrC family response regulator
MTKVYDTIELIGRSNATVFITGESGTGKELCAEAIHAVSPRSDQPFVPLNCGAIPPDLLESEVFGHLRGSFTGAVSDKDGAAVAANGGTLFLDEICEMDLALQTKLLRFIQTSTVQPVGATMPRQVDVRILCATNRDPHAEVAAGRFRADLFYRLHVVPIHLPPLRERGEDVILIAEKLLREYAAEEGRVFRGLSQEVEDIFCAVEWPGNVRQLLNVIRNVVVLSDGFEVTRSMLPPGVWGAGPAEVGLPARPPQTTPELKSSMQPRTDAIPDGTSPATRATGDSIAPLVGHTLADIERRLIEATVEACGGSMTRAAQMLDVSPSTLYRKRASWRSAKPPLAG